MFRNNKRRFGGHGLSAQFKPGTQIAYIPNHASGIDDKDVEFGFVTSMSMSEKRSYFCRYWIRGQPGVLRTKSCSECTPADMLVKYKSTAQADVDSLLSTLYPKGEPS